MPRWSVVLCASILVACSAPEKQRKTTDPDLWDPRHEALLNQEDPPEPRKDPEYTRATKSGAASATLSETDRENQAGVEELEKTRARQRAAREARERDEQTREARWVEREREDDSRAFARDARRVRLSLVLQRPLGVLLEQALAHGATNGELRAALDFADRRAQRLDDRALERRERAQRASRDAELQAKLHASGHAGAQTSLRAARDAHARHVDALRAEEAALRAAEAARRTRRAFLGG